MPSRRTPHGTDANQTNSNFPSPKPSRNQRYRGQQSFAPEPQPSPAPDSALSASHYTYNANLKALRRRDSSIVTIFDQFSYVCVYHHVGGQWEKKGFEGTMFFVERNCYPPYSFYILNRMGAEDFVLHLYPENDLGPPSDFPMIRSFPEFTEQRLARLGPSWPTDVFSDFYNLDPLDLPKELKGKGVTLGFWAKETEEAIREVLTRLYMCIRANVRYPDEFRYGPDRPRPNPSMREVTASPAQSRTQQITQASNPSLSTLTARPPLAHGVSDVDRLFSRLVSPQPDAPSVSTDVTVESLFASLTSKSQPPSNDGTSLLNSLFSSNSTTPNQLPQTRLQESIPIYSPKPTTSTLPQILNQDVIYNLLGLPSSRSTSVATSSLDGNGSSSHSSSREGDNEDDSMDERASGRSESGLMYAPNPGLQRNGPPITGDATPRAPLSTLLSKLDASQSIADVFPVASNAIRTGQSFAAPSQPRDLVPFESESELWPYSPVQDDGENDIVELDFNDMSALSDPVALRRVVQKSKNVPAPAVNGHLKGRDNTKGKTKEMQMQAIEDGWDLPKPLHIKNKEVNGASTASVPLDAKIAAASIIDVVSQRSNQPAVSNRNDFVREVLRLIHTDKTFVDMLWTEYQSNIGQT